MHQACDIIEIAFLWYVICRLNGIYIALFIVDFNYMKLYYLFLLKALVLKKS